MRFVTHHGQEIGGNHAVGEFEHESSQQHPAAGRAVLVQLHEVGKGQGETGDSGVGRLPSRDERVGNAVPGFAAVSGLARSIQWF